MSAMKSATGHSTACCNIPPIISKGYEGKGSYEQTGGLNTYAVGPADAEKGLVVVFDIFGFFPQTVQGADIMSGSGSDKYRVLVPDWFEGSPAHFSWYPPTDDEKKANLEAFFVKNPPTRVEPLVPEYIKAASAKYPNIKSWAIIGYCWGGKVSALTAHSPAKAAVSIHPAMLDPADGAKATVPFCLLASKDEDPDDVKAFDEALKVPKHVETFPDQIHGWMAARSDLEDPKVEAEYRRGYQVVLKFLKENL